MLGEKTISISFTNEKYPVFPKLGTAAEGPDFLVFTFVHDEEIRRSGLDKQRIEELLRIGFLVETWNWERDAGCRGYWLSGRKSMFRDDVSKKSLSVQIPFYTDVNDVR